MPGQAVPRLFGGRGCGLSKFGKITLEKNKRIKRTRGTAWQCERPSSRQYRYNEWIEIKTKDVRFTELYDLKNDPLCKENIVVKPEHKELVAQLHEMMRQGWQNAKP